MQQGSTGVPGGASGCTYRHRPQAVARSDDAAHPWFTRRVFACAGEWPGPFIEEETQEVVGYHKGFWFHTVGQRKGVPLSGGPW